MPTQNVTVPFIDAEAFVASPSVGLRTVASGSEQNPTWVLHVTDMSGNLITDLSPAPTAGAAEVDSITWTLNQPDECEFHFPKNAFTKADIFPLGTSSDHHELQVYRNGDLVFWGPIVSLDASGSDGVVRCHAAGVDWYLNRRFLDGTITNALSNPDFEDGLDGWTTHDNSGGLTASVDTSTFETGSQCIKLVNTNDGGDDYISQTVTMGGNAVGLLVTLSGWLLMDELTGPAFGTRGLYMEGRRGGALQGLPNWQPIDLAPSPGATGTWWKMSTTLWIPPSITWDIEVRLYAPKGTVHWDDVKLVAMDSLTCANFDDLTLVPIDISDCVARIIAHVQNPAFGKSSLNLTYDVTDTGVKLSKVYQFVDHIQFDQAMREFIERIDGVDYFVRLTPTTRTFKQFAGKRGTDRTGDFELIYDPENAADSVSDYRLSYDGASCITRQVVLGEDNGPDREQGEQSEASAISGLILQDVKQAPQDSTVASLQPFADEQIARFSEVPFTVELDVLSKAELVSVLHVGDMVSVLINDGWTDNLTASLRIMRIKLDAVKNMLTLTLAQDGLV